LLVPCSWFRSVDSPPQTGELQRQTNTPRLSIARLFFCFRSRQDSNYSRLPESEAAADVQLERAKHELATIDTDMSLPELPQTKLPLRHVWTRNLVLTLCATAFYDFHLGAFANMWTLFLATPRPDTTKQSGSPTGGLGMSAATLGLATSIIGWLGMLLQVVLYPPVHARLGTLKSFQRFLLLFPAQYFLTPYLSILPSSSGAAREAPGGLLWLGLLSILLIHTVARTMTLPASIILVNNACPHPSVLGTVHALGQSVSAAFRTLGPIIGGQWYGASLDYGMVSLSWWAVGVVAGLGWTVSFMLHEGGGQHRR
jgi:hypothetical protein